MTATWSAASGGGSLTAGESLPTARNYRAAAMSVPADESLAKWEQAATTEYMVTNETVTPDVPVARRYMYRLAAGSAGSLTLTGVALGNGWPDLAALFAAAAVGLGSLAGTAAARYLSRGRL